MTVKTLILALVFYCALHLALRAWKTRGRTRD
jgi:hypothetical protein